LEAQFPLRITPDRTKNWVYRFMRNGRARWMGLRPVTLFGDPAEGVTFDPSKIHLEKLRDEFANKVRRWEKKQTKADIEAFILDAIFVKLPSPPLRPRKKAGRGQCRCAHFAAGLERRVCCACLRFERIVSLRSKAKRRTR